MTALDYLKQKEFSMGNGQCPECCGVGASWHGHPLHKTPETIGHKAGCPLAAAIASCGGSPIYIGTLRDLPLAKRYAPGSVYHAHINSKEYLDQKKKMQDEWDAFIISVIDRDSVGQLK